MIYQIKQVIEITFLNKNYYTNIIIYFFLLSSVISADAAKKIKNYKSWINQL